MPVPRTSDHGFVDWDRRIRVDPIIKKGGLGGIEVDELRSYVHKRRKALPRSNDPTVEPPMQERDRGRFRLVR